MITREAFGINFTKWDQVIKAAAGPVGIDYRALKALAMNESSLWGNPRVARGLLSPSDVEGSKSTDGLSWGGFQMQPSTAQDYDPAATPERLNDPAYSATLAAKHYRRLLAVFGGNEEFAVRAYNAGEGRIREELKDKLPISATDYWTKFQEHKALLA